MRLGCFGFRVIECMVKSIDGELWLSLLYVFSQISWFGEENKINWLNQIH